MDLRHAEKEAELRVQHIKRANNMLWDEKEDCRDFHSKLLLCDVLEERRAQIRHTSAVAEFKRKAEIDLLDHLREQWQVHYKVLVHATQLMFTCN
jgi:hypothetical protein